MRARSLSKQRQILTASYAVYPEERWHPRLDGLFGSERISPYCPNTWGLHPLNIMVSCENDQGGLAATKNLRITAILDWMFVGSYPRGFFKALNTVGTRGSFSRLMLLDLTCGVLDRLRPQQVVRMIYNSKEGSFFAETYLGLLYIVGWMESQRRKERPIRLGPNISTWSATERKFLI